jgi:Xaa-Pro aminopeptidase
VTPRTEYDSVVEAISHSRRKPLAPKIAHLRAIKSEAELAVMRTAADISGRAHAKVWEPFPLVCIEPIRHSDHAIHTARAVGSGSCGPL